MNIGFVGTGLMGSRMAAHLISPEDSLFVYNRTRSKTAALESKGAKVCETPGEVGSRAEVLITMLTGPEAVEQNALGGSGFLARMASGSIWVDMSTVNPSFSRKMAAEAREHNVRFLDAPVAGTLAPAEQGELLILVGGDTEDVNTVSPLFDKMGKKTLHLGENGKGTSMKLVINLMLAQGMVAFSEATKLGEALGLERETLLEALIGGPVAPPYLAGKQENFRKNSFETAFPLKHVLKDIHLALESAYEEEIALPSSAAARELYGMALEAGHGEEDFSALFGFVREK